jgi:acyl dehydratase
MADIGVDYTDFIGKKYAPYSVEVEKGRLRSFANAIGSTDPVHLDEAAARSAGHRALMAAPTFAFSVMMDGGALFNILTEMEIPQTKTVHGSQGFRYIRPIYAGVVISGRQTIADIYEKKGGALVFIEVENTLTNDRGEDVCVLRSTIVVRNS